MAAGRLAGLVAFALALGLPAPALADHAGPLGAQWHLDQAASVPVGSEAAVGTTPDSSGHGLTARTDVTASDPVTPIDLADGGRFGRALGEVNSRPIFAESPLLRPQRITLLGWVRRSGSPGNNQYIAGQGDSGAACAGSSYALRSPSDDDTPGLLFSVRGPLGQVIASPNAGTALWDGQWHMVAGVYDGGRVRLYVDGVQVGAGTPAPGVAIDYGLSGNRFYMDGYPVAACGNFDFTGGIDELRLYRRALSPTEIFRLAATPGPNPPVLVPDSRRRPAPRPRPRPGPEAPDVTDVRPASSIRGDRPVVLTASVSGASRTVEWNVRGGSGAEIVGEGLQNSLSYRPRPGTHTISVRAVGPGGASPWVSETITMPARPGGPLSRSIFKVLDKKAPVYAVGSARDLTAPVKGINPVKRNVFDAFKDECLSVPTTLRVGAVEATGCMRKITSVDDVPPRERGFLSTLSFKRRILTVKDGRLRWEITRVNKALNLLDGYLAIGRTKVNGASLTPRGDAALAIFQQDNVIASSDAGLSVGRLTLANPPSFALDTTPRGGDIPLGSFPRAPVRGNLSTMGGFEIDGLVDVSLPPNDPGASAEALVKPYLKLPPFLKFGEEAIRKAVKVRATAEQGLIIDALHIGPLSPNIGALDVKDFRIDYNRLPNDEWFGQGKACIIGGGTCLNMIPDDGHVSIRRGELHFIGANLEFRPAIPIFTGVDLDSINFKLGLNPTRLGGGAGVTGVKAYDIRGRALVAFPSPRTPFVLDPNEIGGFPKHFYGRAHRLTTVGITADAGLKLPAPFGRVPLGDGYFLYEYPGYLAAGGGFNQKFANALSLRGAMSGEFNTDNGKFNVHGNVEGCFILLDELFGIGDVCRGAVGNVSSNGVAGCATLGVSLGVGIKFDPFDVTPYLWGCKWSPYQELDVRGRTARASAVGLPRTVRIGRGRPGRSIRLDSASGAPRIRVTGPGGQVADSSAGNGLIERGGIRILRSAKIKTTVAAFKAPGTYRIATLPGSPAVTRLRQAIEPRSAKVTARVRGRGERRVLAYAIRRRQAQRVTFLERTSSGLSKPIGTVRGGGRGRLRFRPAPGRGRRRIVAQFELDGLPAERRTVASFRPPNPRLGKPRSLRVRRRGTRLRVGWKRVRGARRYQVVVTTSGGVQRVRRTRGRRIIVKGIPRSSRGRVSVRAVAQLRHGPSARKRFRRIARHRTRFEKLPRAPRLRRGR
ncbi:MAG: LamG domain-containing protein [Actinomycetota bacterium]|nr:LamG domain-containing protein [Actinomycetota bacterium]